MSEPEVRYGVIGTGMMGCEHIANINWLPGAQVVAVADPHEPSLDAASELSPEARRFSGHDDLLDAQMCDAVVIATPNMTHAPILADVLKADVHVLVEKPLCTTVADCLATLDAARARSHLIWVGLEYRFMAPFARLIEEVAAGTAGRVRMVSMREHRFPFLDKVGCWNRFNANTGGTLVEKCCHFFDLMNLVMPGAPVQVYASGSQMLNHLDERHGERVPDILDSAYVIVDYDDGARAMLDLCMFAEATRNQQELVAVGDAAKIEALVPEDIVRIGRRGVHSIGDVETHPARSNALYQGLHHGSSYEEHRHFLNAIHHGDHGESSRESLQAALVSVAMGEAAHLSIEHSRPIPLTQVLPG